MGTNQSSWRRGIDFLQLRYELSNGHSNFISFWQSNLGRNLEEQVSKTRPVKSLLKSKEGFERIIGDCIESQGSWYTNKEVTFLEPTNYFSFILDIGLYSPFAYKSWDS